MPTVENKQYEGKYFSILGDSISTLCGYNPPDYAVFYQGENCRLCQVFAPEDTWWGQVLERLKAKLLVNNAFSGSLVCHHPACQIPSYGCSDERTGLLHKGQAHPDVVMILMGINDWGCGMQLQPNGEYQGLRVFSVAYRTMLQKIKNNYPRAEIWCLTLPRSCWSAQPQVLIPAYRAGGHYGEYCNVIAQCAALEGCRLVELYDPAHPYDTVDGFHPTRAGMQTIADGVLAALEK